MKGKLIVLEGADGTGKTTQLELLVNRLEKENKNIVNLHFPKHGVSFGKNVDAYLRGDFGLKENLPSEFIAMLYMTDFYESKKDLEELIEKGNTIILSRYFSSTLTYQVAQELKEKEKIWDWIINVSSRLPQPDLTIVLNVTQEYAEKLMSNPNRVENYKHGYDRDQHEKDFNLQKEVRNVYKKNIEKLGWKEIMCVKDNSLLSIQEIHELIYDEVKKIL
ncbi:MAG: dTMP kinase [Candidatus ainarchaeum sp.]|nr:dTMP kinase [Candidatus ainarchaeum sp.]